MSLPRFQGSDRTQCPYGEVQISLGCVSCQWSACVQVCQHCVICELPLPILIPNLHSNLLEPTCGSVSQVRDSVILFLLPGVTSPPGPSHIPKPVLEPSQAPGKNLPNLQESNQVHLY